jgi:hypothetical protein
MRVPEQSVHTMSALGSAGSTHWFHPSELPDDVFAPAELVIPIRPGYRPWPLYMAYVASVGSGKISLVNGFYPFRHLGDFYFELEYPAFGPVFVRQPRPATHVYGGKLDHPDLDYRLMGLQPEDPDLYESMFAYMGLLVVGVPAWEYRRKQDRIRRT